VLWISKLVFTKTPQVELCRRQSGKAIPPRTRARGRNTSDRARAMGEVDPDSVLMESRSIQTAKSEAVTGPTPTSKPTGPPPPFVVWKQALHVMVCVVIIILPLGEGGVLKAMAAAGLSLPVVLLLLIPPVVMAILFILMPLLVKLTMGWIFLRSCPGTRCEPARTLEEGFCCFRPDPPAKPVDPPAGPMLEGAAIASLESLSGTAISSKAPSPPTPASAAVVQKPHLWKLAAVTATGLYPSLIFVGFPAGQTLLNAGLPTWAGTLATIATAVTVVVFVASPTVAKLWMPWLRDHESGECSCLPGPVRRCCERGLF
jgi:antibiotic biosynthesis monooxygenase (ABM) superfamily enzyme